MPVDVTKLRSLTTTKGLLVLGILAVGATVLLPIVILLVLSFQSKTGLGKSPLTLENYQEMFSSGRAVEGLTNTLMFTIGGASLALVLGVTMAWAITSVNVPFRRVLQVLPMCVLVLPPLLKDMAYIMLFAKDTGLVNVFAKNVLGIEGNVVNIFSIWGMIVVMGIFQAPVVYSIMLVPFQGIDRAQIEASRMSGVKLPRTMFKVVLPTVLPAMLSAFTLTVISIASSFETPVLIGLPGGVHTYMSEIYRSMTSQVGGLNMAAAQATLYFVLTTCLVGLYMLATRNEAKFEAVGGKGHAHTLINAPILRWVLAGFVVLYLIFGFVAPLTITILAAFIPFYTVVYGNPFHSFTLDNFREVFTEPNVLSAIQTSGMLATVAAVGTVVVAGFLAVFALKSGNKYRRVGEFLAMAPKAVPGVVYSVGLLLTILAAPGLAKFGYGSIVLMYIAVIVSSLPFAYRLISSSLIQVSDELLEASRMSGGSPGRGVRTVLLPIVRPALFYAAAVIFVMGYRELGSIVFLVPPNTSVVSHLSFQFWVAGGLPMTAALNLVAVAVPLIAVGILFSVAKLRLPTRRRRPPHGGDDVPALEKISEVKEYAH